ncbi:DNA-binding transcriptional ArsR family regulator [Evansella vedderi]|uniref:DNA-binding transcriptional ArsR family regulator n=1 Tax=Evansella vedderi TaxID=38282 RepID=A0ABU0A209_9BACI|nr:helix-turn-helix domain-containing protein [Evansella vedderi]MDQ0257519.1 DNA-binding transcriptional ArsR family regulator [Evansella vedderi]
MGQSKGDVILHPVRMKIIQALAGRSLTVQDLMDKIPDIPQATMYRHLNMLKKHQIVLVQDEQKKRGVIEKTYTLDVRNSFISGEEAKQISKEDYLRYFMMFYGNLLRLMEEYFEDEVNLEKDGFGFHQLELNLNEEEGVRFLQDYKALITKYQFEPRGDRKKRTMATAFIPERNGDRKSE